MVSQVLLDPSPQPQPDQPACPATRLCVAAQSLDAWDAYLKRVALRAAFAFGGDRDDADDIAQAIRIRLERALRFASSPLPPAYLRALIRNTAITAIHAARRAYTTRSVDVTTITRDEDVPLHLHHRDDLEGLERSMCVRRWLSTQPSISQRLYCLLYHDGLTQREVADVLGVSQPRVAQLHARLLARGRESLEGLVE